MSRRSVQRKMWHSVYKGIESPSSPLTVWDWLLRILVVSLIVYMFVVK